MKIAELNQKYLNTTFYGIGMVICSLRLFYGKYNVNLLSYTENECQVQLTPYKWVKNGRPYIIIFNYEKATEMNMKKIVKIKLK